MSNLRALGNAFNTFATDHTTNYPWQVSATNGGSVESIASGSPAPHFQTLSNYLSPNWRVLSCPADRSRRPTTDPLRTLIPANISYFCSIDATPSQPQSIIAGDRNLQVSGLPVKPGLVAITSNTSIAWTREGHGAITRTPGGSLAFADGHFEVSRENIPALFQRRSLATNRLAIP